MSLPDQQRKWMKEALLEAKKALEECEVAVGCVFVHAPSQKIVCRGHNLTNQTRNGTQHAELVALKQFYSEINKSSCQNDQENFKFPTNDAEIVAFFRDCELYVTVEPCIMCATALFYLQIGKVFYGCKNEKFGGCGSVFSIHKLNHIEEHTHNCKCGEQYESIHFTEFEEEAVLMLKIFYNQENSSAPKPNKRRRVEPEELISQVTFSKISTDSKPSSE